MLGPIPIEDRITSAQPNPENERRMAAALDRAWVPDEAGLTPGEEDNRIGSLTLRWKRVSSAPDALDLNHALGETQNAVAYAVAVFEAPRAVSGLNLRFASDDAAKVWLNGREIWRVNTTRGVNLDQDVVPKVSLRAGRNVLVVKVVQGVGGWGLAVRFERPDGSPYRLRD